MEGPALNARKTGVKRRHESLLRALQQPTSTVPKLADETNFQFNVISSEKLPEYVQLDLFHRAVYPFMLLAQCFGVMPLTGIREPNPRRVRFVYKSLPMIVTLTFMAATLTLLLAMLKHLLQIGINAKNFVGFVFFGCVLSACVVFIRLARRWPPLIRYWTRTELVFTRAPYEMPKRNLYKRVQLAGMIIIGLSIGEHAMYQISSILSYIRRVHLCSAAANITAVTSFKDYINSNYDYAFAWLSYSHIIAALLLLISAVCTFVWNYMDLFIMMVSKGLCYRFEQITARIRKLEHEEVVESTFIEIREHYVKMCELLEYVDSSMSSLILLSCVNNLYFVCYQLLNVFNKLRWPINYIYFWYSLLYLIGRTAFVFLTAADINEESKRGLGVLRRVSSKSWCVEVERLIFQMTTQTVALSGKKFYFLTRRLLFGMAGTIVTYELVLLQFDEPNRRKGLLPLCA